MLWLWVCFIIDGLDGTFARLANVKETLPDWDGKTIDYVIDFCTYAVIPAYFMYEAPMLGEAWRFPIAAIVLLTSAMYYGKMGMVSTDNYFIGFPVLWNFVIFYQFFVFQTSETTNIITTLLLCVLHFVPIKVPYPSQSLGFRWLHMVALTVAILSNALLLYYYPAVNSILNGLSMLFLAYVTVWSAFATMKFKR
jgi:phosphatidylcholine synthase